MSTVASESSGKTLLRREMTSPISTRSGRWPMIVGVVEHQRIGEVLAVEHDQPAVERVVATAASAASMNDSAGSTSTPIPRSVARVLRVVTANSPTSGLPGTA